MAHVESGLACGELAGVAHVESGLACGELAGVACVESGQERRVLSVAWSDM